MDKYFLCEEDLGTKTIIHCFYATQLSNGMEKYLLVCINNTTICTYIKQNSILFSLFHAVPSS